MHRFFIPKDWIQQDSVTITGEPLHQIGYVLRLKPLDRIIVLDNSGWELRRQYSCPGNFCGYS